MAILLLLRRLVLALWLFPSSVDAWTPQCEISSKRATRNLQSLQALRTSTSSDQFVDDDVDIPSSRMNLWTRRSLAQSLMATSATTVTAASIILAPIPTNALVKGNAPPPPKSAKADKKKCTNVEECQALAELQADVDRQEALKDAVPTLTTRGGTRYRDLQVGKDDASVSSIPIASGMTVTLYYKVLKLGKRSYDGLSGEGTVIFSRGYGLEDDEDEAGTKSFTTTVGSPFNIVALNEALIGMRVGGIRRFAVVPPQGWRKPGNQCDGGPGGRGQGGDLKTDYVVVPTATMVAEEACLDASKQPFPVAYAEQRRMAQRFDQSLIMEVQVVAVGEAADSGAL